MSNSLLQARLQHAPFRLRLYFVGFSTNAESQINLSLHFFMDYGKFYYFWIVLWRIYLFLGFDLRVLLGHFVELDWEYGGESGVWS
jgi:hypothetical protein